MEKDARYYRQIELHARAQGARGGYYIKITPPGGRSYMAMLRSGPKATIENDETVPLLTQVMEDEEERR